MEIRLSPKVTDDLNKRRKLTTPDRLWLQLCMGIITEQEYSDRLSTYYATLPSTVK